MASRIPRPLWAAVLAVALAAAACGGGQQAQPEAAPKTVSPPIDPATAGTVTGHVTLQGTPPANEPIKTKSDPNCSVPITTQAYVVGSGGSLANVFVYVKDGLGNRVFPVPTTSVVLGQKNQHVFSTKEVMFPFACDVHKWMNAYLGVVDNPFYAVTGTDGAFSLKGLPPGTSTVEAVHEKLGRQSQMVTIGEKETKDVSFGFTI
jgi:hypothetical protein